jgi:hypothetical protein
MHQNKFLNGNKIIQLSIRPPRIAFILNDISQGIPVIRACSLSWGGKFFALIPYTDDGGISSEWWNVLRKYDPDDIITCCDLPVEIQEKLSDLLHRREQYQDISPRLLHSWNLQIDRKAIRGLPIFNVLYGLRSIEKREEFMPVRIPQFSNMPIGDDIFQISRYGFYVEDINQTGDILAGNGFNNYRLGLNDFLRVNYFNSDYFEYLYETERQFYHKKKEHSLIDYTAVSLGITYDRPSFLYQPDYEQFGESGILILAESDSLEDLCWFWNLRSQREPGLFPIWLSPKMLDDNLTQINQLIAGKPPFYLMSKSLSSKKLINISKKMDCELKVLVKDFDSFYSPKFRSRKSTAMEVVFEDGSFLINPSGFLEKTESVHYCKYPAYYYFDIEIPDYILPLIKTVEWHKESIGPYIRTKSGLSIISSPSMQNNYQTIRLPSPFEMMKTCFRVAGYDIALSDKGILANAILDLLQDKNNVWILSGKTINDLLDKLSVDKHFIRGNQELETDILENFKVQMKYEEIKKKLGFSNEITNRIIQWLLKANFLQRGIVAKCTYCNNKIWLSVDGIKSSLQCMGCGKIFDVTELGVDGLHWLYRLNPLVSKGIRQGIMPHLLALYSLQDVIRNKYLISPFVGGFPGLKIAKSRCKDVFMEIDIAWISDGKIGIGECKTSGKDLTRNEIERYMILAKEINCDNVVFAALDQIDEKLVEGNFKNSEVKYQILGAQELMNNYPGRGETSDTAKDLYNQYLEMHFNWEREE